MKKYTTEELHKRFGIIQSPNQPGLEYREVTDEELHERAIEEDEWEADWKLLNEMIDQEGPSASKIITR